MRKTRVRKRTNKKRTLRNRRTHRQRTHRMKRGGSITTLLEGEDRKELGTIVVAGPMGVMSRNAYMQAMANLDQQGAE
jgi:hypothetical protein